MKYRLPLSSHHLRLWRWLILLAVFCAVLEYVGFFNAPRAWWAENITPLTQVSFNLTNLLKWPQLILTTWWEDKNEILKWRSVCSLTTEQLAELDQLRAQNAELKTWLTGQTKSQLPKLWGVPILSHNFPAVLVPQNSTVKLGQMVLIGNTFMGRIGSVMDNQARVILLSDNLSKPVLAQTERGETGVVMSVGGVVTLTQIPITADIREGDMVVTMAAEQIPAGVLIGRIKKIVATPNQPLKQAALEQYVSFLSASAVEIY